MSGNIDSKYEYDVKSVGIGESSTDYGGKNAGGKAKTNFTYKNLQVDAVQTSHTKSD